MNMLFESEKLETVYFMGLWHWQGCDIAKGTTVLKAGEQIGNPEIGLLATVGVTVVKVYTLQFVLYLLT